MPGPAWEHGYARAMSRSVRVAVALTAASLGAAVLLSGCKAAPPGDETTRHAVAELARDIAHRRTDDIDQWARYAQRASRGHAAGLTLIGIEPRPGAARGEVVGTLTFLSEATRRGGLFGAETDALSACYAVDFTAYGPVDARRTWGDTSLVRDVTCPDDASEVVPPPDTSPVFVVPAEAEEVVRDVVAAASADLTADDIAAAVTARLPVPTGPYERLAAVDVHRSADGSIGVAMGDSERCLLVRRIGDVTERVHAPRVLLQPGEFGCRGDTALRDLRPPH